MNHQQTIRRRNREAARNGGVASCRKASGRIQKVRNSIFTEAQEAFRAPERLVHLALNEAEALAWQTQYPQLVFPTLAQEKVDSVLAWSDRQREVKRPWGSRTTTPDSAEQEVLLSE